MSEEELLLDLQRKVEEYFQTQLGEAYERVAKLYRAGSGVLELHRIALEEGQDYREANAVIDAIVQDLHNTRSHRLIGRELLDRVRNYFQLL